MTPIIKWTLWHRRWSIVFWSLGVAAFIGLELGVYSSIKSQAALARGNMLTIGLNRAPAASIATTI